ncbi:hypothetical protein D3C73_609300 [compost metagenome]
MIVFLQVKKYKRAFVIAHLVGRIGVCQISLHITVIRGRLIWSNLVFGYFSDFVTVHRIN